MARRRWLATIVAYLILELGALLGVPMRPDQIELMTRLLNQTQVMRVERGESGGDPPDPARLNDREPRRQRRRRCKR